MVTRLYNILIFSLCFHFPLQVFSKLYTNLPHTTSISPTPFPRDNHRRPYIAVFSRSGACCVIDHCNLESKCLSPLSEFQDSCGQTYSVIRECQFIPLILHYDDDACCFHDACSRRRVCVMSESQYVDACGTSLWISQSCRILRTVLRKSDNLRNHPTCCFEDPCAKEGSGQICAKPGDVITLKCGMTFSVSMYCSLSLITDHRQDFTHEDRHIGDHNGMDMYNRHEKFGSYGESSFVLGITDLTNPDEDDDEFDNDDVEEDDAVNAEDEIYVPADNENIGDKHCCVIDQCSRNVICTTPEKSVTDSCGTTFNFSPECTLIYASEQANREVCCYKDGCNETTICAVPGGLLSDSCHQSYQVHVDCSLIDVTSRSEINENKEEDEDENGPGAENKRLLNDNSSYRELKNKPNKQTTTKRTRTVNHCCYKDACNGKKICANDNATFVDSCRNRYLVVASKNCGVKPINVTAKKITKGSQNKYEKQLQSKFKTNWPWFLLWFK